MKQSRKEEEAKIKMHKDYQRRTFIHQKKYVQALAMRGLHLSNL